MERVKQRLDPFLTPFAILALDAEEHLAYLCDGNWRLARTMELYPDIVFNKTREHN